VCIKFIKASNYIGCLDFYMLILVCFVGDAQWNKKHLFSQAFFSGEGGIRTRGGGLSPRTHLAGEPNRPLWHLPIKLVWMKPAEGVGFEPTVAFTTTVFKTVTFSRSVIPPSGAILPQIH
jgi:hypothetical protein